MLAVERLEAGYGDVQVLFGVSLAVGAGEMVALVGSNGAGKTTLLRSIHGMARIRSGSIRLDGRPIHHLPVHRIGQLGVAHVLEGRQLFPDMTVRENLLLGAHRAPARPRLRGNLERLLELFPVLGERLRQRAGTLSGGQQQMLAIARALMLEPRLLLVDEPSLGLAPLLVEELFRALAAVKQEGIAVVLAEQNVHLALRIADRACVIEEGRVVLEGPAPALLDDPRIRDAYLGVR